MSGCDIVQDGVLLVLPEDEREQLQGRTSRQVRDWITSKLCVMHRHMSNLQFVHNATLAVNKLPNELLVEILCLASAVPELHRGVTWISRTALHASGVTWITKTAGVCRSWRDVIVNTRLLWTEIDLSANLHFTKLCLARSNGASITLSLPYDARQRSWSRTRFSVIMDLLFLHYSRIKRIDLAIRNKPNPLSFILKDLPALVSLSLALDMHELTRRTPNLLNIPSLRHLSLRGVTPDWGTMPLSQLTSLLLSGISFSADAPFISPLEACTSLEALQISFQASNTFPSTAHHTLSFPRMQHMQLSGAPAHIAHFLAQVSLPRHARLSLEPTFHPRYGNGDVDTAPVLQAFLPKVTGHLPYLSEARHLMMWVDIFYGDNVYITMYADVERTAFWDLKPWRSCRSTGGQYPDYEVPFKPLPGGPMVPLFFFIRGAGRQWREDVTDHSLKRMLHDLMPELDRLFPSSLETLILRGTTSLVDTQTWAHTLAAFPNIKQLEIIGQECDIDGFAEALEPTSAGMPCARLRELALQYEPQKQDGSLTILQTLRAVLQKRAEVAGGSRLQALSLLMVPARPRGYGLLPRVWLAEESRAAFDETLGDLESMVVSFVFGQIASVPVKRKDEGGQGQERDLGEDDFLEDQWSSEDQDQWSPESEE